MRSILIAGLGMALSIAAWAQTPPKNAVDITNVPATAAQANAGAPSAAIGMPAGVVRVYIGSLSGADAAAVQGLLTQALFESKKVVVTENQSNASLILQGRVLRRLPPAPAGSKTKTKSRSRRRRPTADIPDTTDPSVIKDLEGLKITSLDAQNSSGSADVLGGNGSLNGLTLPALGVSDDSEVDLGRYQYRLDLQLVNPDGDLVWMSGQGGQAAPFSTAAAAVGTCVQPMLNAITSLAQPTKPDQP